MGKSFTEDRAAGGHKDSQSDYRGQEREGEVRQKRRWSDDTSYTMAWLTHECQGTGITGKS